MIKDCRVILNNEAVTVARFGEIDVQFPSIHADAKFVRVLYKDGHYSIVNSDYVEADEIAIVKEDRNNRKTKKTTIEEKEVETPIEEVALDAE